MERIELNHLRCPSDRNRTAFPGTKGCAPSATTLTALDPTQPSATGTFRQPLEHVADSEPPFIATSGELLNLGGRKVPRNYPNCTDEWPQSIGHLRGQQLARGLVENAVLFVAVEIEPLECVHGLA